MAVAAELVGDAGVDVHIASFGDMAKLVPAGVSFHALPGQSVKQMVVSKGKPFLPKHAPGVQGALQSYDETMVLLLAPHEQEEYFAIFDYCVELIERVNPAVVVLDPIFAPGTDAARFLNKTQVILSPGTFKDHALHLQPRLQFVWKYPV
jgi:hypothetical protein